MLSIQPRDVPAPPSPDAFGRLAASRSGRPSHRARGRHHHLPSPTDIATAPPPLHPFELSSPTHYTW
ncbi:hypothetical protein BS78_K185900 [Paspalum vaginatum]|uniref:Uncharacterized protein n=1 Tax=Paspalum vaginatum TaxID=158149 RepID=A0A9W8CFS2_9POAL|nr:hypothetical protein BS78_K185900 [Paspalum vaginatum]